MKTFSKEEIKSFDTESERILARNERDYRFLRHTPKEEWHIPFIEEDGYNQYPGVNKARLILEGIAWVLVSVGVVVLAAQYNL